VPALGTGSVMKGKLYIPAQKGGEGKNFLFLEKGDKKVTRKNNEGWGGDRVGWKGEKPGTPPLKI